MSRYPWWQMATAIRNGVDADEALKSLTIVPAKILGLDDQVGTLEVGKRANLQVLTGDPLQAETWVEKVLLDGEVVYDRSKDARLQYLFGKTDEKKSAVKKGSK
jgi:imidazolonepropionase-like amidohydrolase